MRIACALVAMAVGVPVAGADDTLRVRGAVGGGAQGDATYSALELGVDVAWRTLELGLAARAVWDDSTFRRSDWSSARDAVAVVRHLQLRGEHVALAGGALSPSQLGRVAEGHRASLDDRWRTGARGALATSRVTSTLEIDDVLDPALIGGALAVGVSPEWALSAAVAVDPLDEERPSRSGIEIGAARRWDAAHRRLELGASLIAEPREGATVVGFGSFAVDHGGARWSATADLRGGNGTSGAAFGPLYRIEREGLIERASGGIAGGVSAQVASRSAWAMASARTRPGLGGLVSAAAGTLGPRVQAAGWLAASPDLAAGAAELRVAWGRGLTSSLQLARMYRSADRMDALEPRAAWSLTAWFGIGRDVPLDD